MKRRNFLRNISGASIGSLVLNGMPLHSFATSSMLPLLNCQGIDDRVLVIVFMKGANDGINTIIPIDQYDTYANHRPDIKIANSGGNSFIPLDSTLNLADQVGLHPSMTAFKEMYDSGLASLIQGVGYPSPNKSHFKSTDLWLSGGDGTANNFNLQGGWMGRYLESAYPGVYGNPSTDFPDPLGIQLGDSKSSGGFHNHDQLYIASNLSGQDPANLFGLLNGLGAAPHQSSIPSDYGEAIDYIMTTENSTNVYGERITSVYNAGANSSSAYPDSNLGDQLKTVARLISGGSTTKIFLVHKTGFDTHADQIVAGSTHEGKHAELLGDVFNSIKAFNDDLNTMGIGEKVMTCTFSEFGRKAVQNGSYGTDHGNYAPMFLFGAGVEAGVKGTNVNLANLTDKGELLETDIQHDYRSVFKTIIQDWLGAGDQIIDESLFSAYGKIPNLVTDSLLVTPDCYQFPITVLPILLNYFDAIVVEKDKVEIEWKTSSEVNHDYYEVERSNDGNDFESIAKVNGVGDRSSIQDYEYIDESPYAGVSYYRLKSVDNDRQFTYSDVKAIEIKGKNAQHIKLYPNPANFDTNLVMTIEKEIKVEIFIYSILGKLVRQRNLSAVPGFNKFNLDLSDLETGNYVVKINTPDQELATLHLSKIS